jgi:hypothetical protein
MHTMGLIVKVSYLAQVEAQPFIHSWHHLVASFLSLTWLSSKSDKEITFEKN